MLVRIYVSIWSKYRPAILKMMIDAADESQSYQLSHHEFKALNPTSKGAFSFSLEVSAGKATSGLKDSAVAQDLWEILQLSRKASELIADATFRFSMDKQFILHIQKIN
ncbi:hypothetical protein [Ohtaekwangia sp.]|uniref:hypothetical protein n=1 Tax=Ohtaekwangia sp. TaxID=2066019 RepID=UPI002F9317AD